MNQPKRKSTQPTDAAAEAHTHCPCCSSTFLTIHEMERRLILAALKAYPNQEQAAQALGVSVRTIRNKVAAYRAELPAIDK